MPQFPIYGIGDGKVTIHTHIPRMGKQNRIVRCRRVVSRHFPWVGCLDVHVNSPV